MASFSFSAESRFFSLLIMSVANNMIVILRRKFIKQNRNSRIELFKICMRTILHLNHWLSMEGSEKNYIACDDQHFLSSKFYTFNIIMNPTGCHPCPYFIKVVNQIIGLGKWIFSSRISSFIWFIFLNPFIIKFFLKLNSKFSAK